MLLHKLQAFLGKQRFYAKRYTKWTSKQKAISFEATTICTPARNIWIWLFHGYDELEEEESNWRSLALLGLQQTWSIVACCCGKLTSPPIINTMFSTFKTSSSCLTNASKHRYLPPTLPCSMASKAQIWAWRAVSIFTVARTPRLSITSPPATSPKHDNIRVISNLAFKFFWVYVDQQFFPSSCLWDME